MSDRDDPKLPRGVAPELAQAIESAIGELVGALPRDGASICPSAVARRLDPDGWKRLMEPVREVARAMRERGAIEVTRHGKPVGPWPWRGVIRLRAARRDPPAPGATARDA